MTYELSAWYEPLLMIDLIAKMKFVCVVEVVVDEVVDIVDDDCGWMKGNFRKKEESGNK